MMFEGKEGKMTERNTTPPLLDNVIQVTSPIVQCDGNGNEAALGHPLVYLNMEDEGQIICPYCSRQFVLVESPF
jgi:uncharacterized Zn-finger protein